MNNNWISVKERLPEKNGDYICTCRWSEDFDKDFHVDVLEYNTQISPSISDDLKDRIFSNGGAFGEMWPDGLDNLMEVKAWMPLPEVYEEIE